MTTGLSEQSPHQHGNSQTSDWQAEFPDEKVKRKQILSDEKLEHQATFTILDVLKGYDQKRGQERKILKQAKEESMTDSLTGCYSRRFFDKQKEIFDNKRTHNNTELAIVMTDINWLKEINDAYGHPVGDQLLIKFTQYLVSKFRIEDHVCRIGGDEFAVIVKNINNDPNFEQNLQSKMEKIVNEIPAFRTELPNEDTVIIQPSFAFGVATYDSAVAITEESPFQQVLQEADQKMYINKEFIKTNSKPLINNNDEENPTVTNPAS